MKAQLWQHPFVDIFKLVNLNEWRVAQQEGDVTECLDRVTGKRVYRIAGSISAGNYIQIPRSKCQLKTLGLTGQYIYLQILEVPEKPFSLHLEYVISNSKTKSDEPLRVSLSNLFKETKLTNAGLQISCHLSEKWTVVVLDLKSLFENFIGSHISAHVLKSLTVCSTLFVKGVYTSDNLYQSGNLPKEMSFKLIRNQNWNDFYDWVVVTAEVKEKVGKKVKKPKKEASRSELSEIVEERPEERPEESKKDIVEEGQKYQEVFETSEKLYKKPRTSEKRLQNISAKSQLKKCIPSNLSETSFNTSNAKPLELSKSEPSNIADLMSPDPLMHLSHVIGYSGNNPRTVRWTKLHSDFSCYPLDFTSGSSKYIIYPSGCTLVLMNPISRKQHFFFGHTAPINSLSISSDGSLLVSGQCTPALALVWDLKTLRPPTFIAFGKMTCLKIVDVSADNKYVVTAGTDIKARETIILWDISGISSGKSPEIKAKQVGNFHLHTIKFSPIDSERLMACGKESIRSWRINKGHLSGKAVVLSHHARASDFMDLDFDIFTSTSKSPVVDNYLKRVFVVSNHGMLFQINYETTEIEGVMQLHDSRINSIVVTEGYCVTGSDDCFLRVWPLDFTEYLLEARHEGPVVSVDISADRFSIVCGTLNCTIGTLDMSSSAYKTLLRSHTAPVLAIDVHPSTGMILTASSDNTLRIWSPEHFEELFEFFSPQDLPLTVSFHPTTAFFACGFESGSLRIFEIETTSMKEEFLQHESRILKCVHSPDSRFLMSASEDGVVCIYNANRSYQPIKTIPVEAVGGKVDACFSCDSKQFAVLGTNGSIIYIWDTISFSQKYRINTAGSVVEKLLFSPNGQDLLVISSGQEFKVKFYGINGFEAVFIKELAGCHAFAEVSEIEVARNCKYLVTGGSDKIIKIWDYAARSNAMRSQGFIGHSYAITHMAFSLDSRYLVSCANGPDGIFVWEFNGDKSPLKEPWAINN